MGGLLWANAILEPWPTGEEYAASCAGSPGHAPPVYTCMCGIWAFHNARLLAESGYGIEDPRHVSGVVSAAGKVVLHDFGWRAQRARVEAIFADGAPDEVLPVSRTEIAVVYDIPVIDSEDYVALCQERGLISFSPDDV
jgi:hypothetical protein